MSAPLISIGITCYNAADTIERAVNSALNQTWENTEIIIVDDQSKDNTSTILQKLCATYPQLILKTHSKNQGVAASRNTIIKHATGDFIAFFDDDDESDSTRLQKQYDRITAYEQEYAQGNPVICYTARTQKYPDGAQRYEGTIGTTQNTIAPHHIAVALRILNGNPAPDIFGSCATCSQMARRSVFKSLNGFDTDFRRSEDTDFNIRAALQNAHFPGIAEPLVMQTMTHASDKTLSDEWHYAQKLLTKHKGFIQEHTNFSFCHDWLAAKYDFLQARWIAFIRQFLWLLVRHPILSLQRLCWALPNAGFNVRLQKHHHKA